jgi:hypothetical protein
MNKFVLGAVAALVLLGIGLFWLQGRAEVERGAPPPVAPPVRPEGPAERRRRGPARPRAAAASELSREQQRFFRYDRDRDLRITRNEMLSTRTNAFRDLDKDGNNLLTFEEWAVTTVQRFDQADADRNGDLTQKEFATTAPKPGATPACRC